MQVCAVLLVAGEQDADRAARLPLRQRLQHRGDGPLGVGRAEAVQAIAPLDEQMGRRRVAAVGGDRVEVGVHQQPGRLVAESGVDVGVLADGHLVDGARAERRQLARQPVHERPFFPVGILGVERHQLRESIHERHRRGYTMAGARVDLRPRSRAGARPGDRARRPIRRGRSRCRRARRSAPCARRRRPRSTAASTTPVWRAAVPSDGFTQHYPDEGAAPSERTEVRVLYDDKNLYVGIDCEQIHSPIVRRLQRRDGSLPSDGVWIDIDSRNDGVSAYHFSINAAGALLDGIHYNDTDFSADWDAIWEAKVATTERGYSVEFRIPLSTLRFTALPVQSWGFQVRRFIDARQETDDWAFFPRSAAGVVPYFGRLDDLVGLPPPGRFELRPFVLGKLEHRAAGADASSLEHGTFTHAVGRARRQGAPHQRADARPDGQPRLRPGRRRHRHPEPVDVRDVLPREAAVLPGRARHLRHHPPRPLHPSHRSPAAAADAERRARRSYARPRPVRDLRRGQGLGHDRRQDHRGRDVGGDRRERRPGADGRRHPGQATGRSARPRSTSCA